jgi:PAS domain S-box-containing protein
MNTSATAKVTKDQLLQENAYLKKIFKSMDEGLIITDSTGIIQKTNAAMEKIWGYTEAELIGKHVTFLSAEPYTVGKNPASIHKLYTEGSMKNMEARYKKKDGTVFYASSNLQILKEADGTVTGAIGVLRDITESRQLYEALRDAERHYRIIADFTHDWETWVDTRGKLKYVSPSCKKITGYSPQEFFLRPDFLKELILQEDIEPLRIAHKKASQTRKELEIQFRIRRRDGKIRWIELHSQPVVVAGQYLGQRGSGRDITKRKQAEDALRQSEERYRVLTDTAADAIITANGQGSIVSWNHGAEKMYGFKAEEIIGQDCVLIMPEDQREQHAYIFSMLINSGKPMASDVPGEGLGRRKDGSVFPVEQTFNLHWPNNEPFFTIIVRDITRRKEVEKRLYESEELFRLNFENAPVGIIVLNKDGALIHVNTFCELCFGRSRDDLMQHGLDRFLHPEDGKNCLQAFIDDHEILRRHTVIENRYIAGDGRTIYTKQHIQGIFDTDGGLLFITLLTEDITAARQLSFFNSTIINKLKDVYSQLKEFDGLLPDNRKFLSTKALIDYGLSPMEHRIASLIHSGNTNASIAQQLCLSENTVKHHITNIYSKLRVKNRLELGNMIRKNHITL